MKINISHYLLLHLVLMGFFSTADAQVYKSISPDGQVTYGDGRASSSVKAERMNDKWAGSSTAQVHKSAAKIALEIFEVSILVDQSFQYCSNLVPESKPTMLKSLNSWRSKNESINSQARLVLIDKHGAEEFKNMTEDINTLMRMVMSSTTRSKSKEEISSMCQAYFVGLGVDELANPSRNPALVKALFDYKMKEKR